MGLFDKKNCDICGDKIGLLGNRKLDDGNLCKNCAAKLSPWFEERRHSTVEEIKRQLDYREENKNAVRNFHTTREFSGDRYHVFLDETSKLNCHMVSNLPEEDYQRMQEICMDFAYNTFVELKEKHAKRSSEQYEKYKYALSLRKEAAEHIGIENIRRSRIAKLVREENDIEAEYKRSGTVLPDFRLMMLIRLEA